MPKDDAATAAAASKFLSLKDIMADMEAAIDDEPVELSELPPLYAADEIQRVKRSLPIPDLNQLAKLWLLIGEGNTGKTLAARYLIERIIEHNKQAQAMVASLAPGNRNLVHFAPGAEQPPSADPREIATWADKYLQAMRKARWGGVWDFGGGDTSLQLMIESQPDMADQCEQAGLAMVAGYLFSPRLDDLVFLKTYERIGFRPRATALILNLGKAEKPSAFNSLRRQPEYKAALDRGAVELWLPSMPQNVALAIEKARVFFSEARDGTGKRQADISLIERVRVREWLLRIEAEFRDIEQAGWMPWT